jgi:small neutral amino acid transporter SnatA (MarC family)
VTAAELLPLAITMMAGPQILSAIVFVTADNPFEVSLAYVAAVATAAT